MIVRHGLPTPYSDQLMITNYELQNEIFSSYSLPENCELRKLLTSSFADKPDFINDIEFNYYTPEQLNILVKRCSNISLSVFHINIRSLNANHDNLCAVLSCCSFKFNV